MEVEDSRLDRSFGYLDDSHRSLIPDATKLFSLAEEHSQTDYESHLHTHDMYMTDQQVEERLDQHLEGTRQSIKEMDAALTQVDEELEDTGEGVRGPSNYAELIGKKRWYKEKYIKLTEELAEIEETSLAEKTGEWSHQRPEYDKPRERFDIETGHERKASRTAVERIKDSRRI